MKESVGIIISLIILVVVIVAVRHHTHDYENTSSNSTEEVSKELDKLDTAHNNNPPILRPAKDIGLDLYPKEALTLVAEDASKHTVDFIVDRMLKDKFIVVNKDGMSYRFKLVKKYRQVKDVKKVK